MRVEKEYRKEAAELVRQRSPWAVAGFVFAYAAAWLFESLEHPGRNTTYALIFAAEVAIALGALAIVRRKRVSAERRLEVSVVAVAAISLLVGVYHIVVDGELEVMASGLVFLTLGSMVVFPWGVRGQLLVSAAAAVSYLAAIVAGVGHVTPLGVNVMGLGLALGFTVLGARLAEKAHLSLLRRDAELKRTNEELERASELKSEFLSTMSHELRTPLNVIIGYLDLLDDGAFGALAQGQLDPVRRAGRSARELFELITATLDLSRLDAGMFALDLRPVDLRELVAELALGASDLAVRPEVQIHWEVEKGLEALETDGRMLKLVLRNLVGNALKFTKEGSVRISVARREGGVEFAVADTGIGIPADAQKQIFEPFHQIDAPQGGAPVGVGLGLHIVRRLVALLGGHIEVESVPSEGATFRVYLPRTRRPAEGVAGLAGGAISSSDAAGANTTP